MGSTETKIEIKYDASSSNIVKTVSDGYNQNITRIPAEEINRVQLSEEDWDQIKKDGSKEFNFCLVNNYNSINECVGLFTDTATEYAFVLDQFRIEYGSDCYSLNFRPGICVEPKNKYKLDQAQIEAVPGKKCKIIYQDYNYNVSDILRCCFEPDKRSCNANLKNNYTTNHCNGAMLQKCKDNMDHPNCILWLEKSFERFDNEALEMYQNWCSNNFDSEICDYFCKISRSNNDYKSAFCDTALQNWCKKHPDNDKCLCVFTPNNIIPEVEKYLGPKECWLAQCSSEPNSKWLTTDQLNIRKKCSVTNCVININKLTLNDNATADFINDCTSGNSSNMQQSTNYSSVEYKNTPYIGFGPEFLLGSLLLILVHVLKN